MADWSVTKEEMAAVGTRYVIRKDGVRIGSASERKSAERLMRECKKESANANPAGH
jgi:hypothetical protein